MVSSNCNIGADIPHLDALIVGAGWSGIWLLHRLRQKNMKVLCVEASEDVGGVWQHTRYPGCRNETETPVYQFSARETWQNWHWTERYPRRQELNEYLRHVAKTLNLYPNLIFGIKISQACWDNTRQLWTVFAGGKRIATSQFFVLCTGYASRKYVPKLRGLDSFEHAYHTSEWPENFDIDQKRVGVIGTGSSGSQVIETLGPKVAHLTVFQRTPNMANPRHQEQLTIASEDAEHMDYSQRYDMMLQTPTGLEINSIPRNAFQDSPEERQRIYEQLWNKGAQNFWFGNYQDLLTNEAANLEAYAFWREKTRARLNNPVKRDLLAPLNPPHPFGTKRPSLESSYFEVYNQDNVDLIDLRVDNIEEVTEQGVRMSSGSFIPLDVIVLATGYDAGIGSQLAIDVRGQNGVDLKEKWGTIGGTSDSPPKGVETYLGIMSHGFPNMIVGCGPQSPAAFGITPRLAELQGDWIAEFLAYVKDRGSRVEVTQEMEREWIKELHRVVNDTLLVKTDGWYMGNNIPGRKKEPLFWFGGIPAYMEYCHAAAGDGYRNFVIR